MGIAVLTEQRVEVLWGGGSPHLRMEKKSKLSLPKSANADQLIDFLKIQYLVKATNRCGCFLSRECLDQVAV